MEERVLRLRRDDLLVPVLVREAHRVLDLRARPVRDADEARLPVPYDLRERRERLRERHIVVVAVALVQVDVVGAQAGERRVDLLEDLAAGKPTVTVRHLAVDLRREDVRVARASLQDLAEELLGAPAGVHVRSVDEVDADLERLRDTGLGLFSVDAPAVGQP